MLILFNTMTEQNLTPNKFFILYYMKLGLSAPGINLNFEIRDLIANGWITDVGETFQLNDKSHELITKVEKLFTVNQKKVNSNLMTDEFSENIEKYNTIFPRIKLGSNKAARSPAKELLVAFKWFFEEYDHSWDIILKATEAYIDSEEGKGFKYTRTSKYFIRKQDTDKSWSSDLAGYCDLINNGDDFKEPKHTDKVF